MTIGFCLLAVFGSLIVLIQSSLLCIDIKSLNSIHFLLYFHGEDIAGVTLALV